jgi:hypothetical protein
MDGKNEDDSLKRVILCCKKSVSMFMVKIKPLKMRQNVQHRLNFMLSLRVKDDAEQMMQSKRGIVGGCFFEICYDEITHHVKN